MDDLVVAPMVPAENEGKLTDAFCQLLDRTRITQNIDGVFSATVYVTVNKIASEPEHGDLQKPYDINLAKSDFHRKLISKVLEYD